MARVLVLLKFKCSLYFRTQRVSILTKYGRFDDALTELGKIKEGGGKAGSEEEIMPKMNELTKLKGAAADAQELMEHDEDYEGDENDALLLYS